MTGARSSCFNLEFGLSDTHQGEKTREDIDGNADGNDMTVTEIPLSNDHTVTEIHRYALVTDGMARYGQSARITSLMPG